MGSSASSNILRNNGYNLSLYDTTKATIKSNSATGGDLGFFVADDSANNTLTSNKAVDNDSYDCQDESTGAGTGGTANTWTKNVGAVADPDAICN